MKISQPSGLRERDDIHCDVCAIEEGRESKAVVIGVEETDHGTTRWSWLCGNHAEVLGEGPYKSDS